MSFSSPLNTKHVDTMRVECDVDLTERDEEAANADVETGQKTADKGDGPTAA
jgi:hypothetical protein